MQYVCKAISTNTKVKNLTYINLRPYVNIQVTVISTSCELITRPFENRKLYMCMFKNHFNHSSIKVISYTKGIINGKLITTLEIIFKILFVIIMRHF